MPSPFPGMDPYIEDQGLWPDFHSKLVNYIQEAVVDRLPPGYDARIDQRIRLVEADDGGYRDVLPDVAVLRDDDAPAGRGRGDGGVATLEPVAVALPVALVEEREAWIEIRTRPDRALVTVIEVLSPSNKRGNYTSKRQDLIRQDVNLVELDLLIGGDRLPVVGRLPAGDYYALVSRADRRPACDAYAWSVRRPLPTIPIPLRPPDPDVPLDLAAVARTAYDRGRYERALRYGRPLQLPLADADRKWAEGVGAGA